MTVIPPENYGIELAVVVERIDGLKTSVDKLEATVTKQQASYATKDDLAARDREIREIKDSHKEAINELKAAHERRQVPWTAVGAFFLGSMSLVIQLVEKIN